MTNFRIENSQQNSIHDFVADLFQAATITLLGVLGFLTFAAAI